MSVKCPAQEHNTMFPARARTQTALSGVECSNHEATAPPTVTKQGSDKKQTNKQKNREVKGHNIREISICS